MLPAAFYCHFCTRCDEHLAPKSPLLLPRFLRCWGARALQLFAMRATTSYDPVLKADVTLLRCIRSGYAGFAGIIARCPPLLIRVSSRAGKVAPNSKVAAG
jgi:hypothetical protein